MSIFSAVVLYFSTWFLTAFFVMHVGLRTQDDDGEVVPGTPPSAPANFSALRLMRRTTLWATLIWAVMVAVILFSGLTVRDFDFFDRMSHRPF